MSDNIKALVPLSFAVAQVKLDLDINDSRRDAKLTQYAIDCIVDISSKVSTSVVVDVITVTNLTAKLPDDFMKYSSIAIIQNGMVVPLTPQHNLNYYQNVDTQLHCPVVAPGANKNSNNYYYWGFRNNQYVGEQYSNNALRNFTGYRIDEENRVINFSSDLIATSILLEYVSTGVKAAGNTMIGREYIELIRAYIHHRLAQNDRSMSLGEKRQRASDYYFKRDETRMFKSMFTKSEWFDTILKNMKLGIKFDG